MRNGFLIACLALFSGCGESKPCPVHGDGFPVVVDYHRVTLEQGSLDPKELMWMKIGDREYVVFQSSAGMVELFGTGPMTAVPADGAPGCQPPVNREMLARQ